MHILMNIKTVRLSLLVATLAEFMIACGHAKDFDKGEELAPAVLGGSGGTRTKTDTIINKTPKPTFNIVPVTQIVQATSGISGWTAAELPFTGPAYAIGQVGVDGQTPFTFTYDYPANNYQFVEAHVVIDTSRDSSDTEGIVVDGVFSGRPPLASVNNTTPEVTDRIYYGSSATTPNTYYIDWSLAHYKINTRNSFDLLLSDLLQGSSKNSIGVLSDGKLQVVTGDDSPVYQAYLVIKGRTISDSALTCVDSSSYTFTNDYHHNDGNTVGQAAFSGSVTNAYTGYNAAIGTYAATEFNFDSALPKVSTSNITVTSAKLSVRLKRSATGKAAIVINGIGIAETGFDKSTATSVVETWKDGSTAAWETALAAVPTNATAKDIDIDLLTLLTATELRDLLAQGKLNVSIAGNVIVYGSALTSARGFASPVNGPELKLNGTYFTEVCTVPNNPASPLTQDGIKGDVGGGDDVVVNDGEGPALQSVQATQITANSATILWLTDESATSQVRYGIGNVNQSTAKDTTLTTYHEIKLTGLSPYKYYSFQVVSEDKFGNASTSEITVFVTLR